MNRALSLSLPLPLQFIPDVRGQVAETQPPTPLPVFSAGSLGASATAQCFEFHSNARRFAVTHHQQMDRFPRPFLSDRHLQLASIGHGLSVELRDHVSGAQSSLRSGRVRLNLTNQRSLSLIHVEELRVVGSNIGDLNSNVRVSYFAVPNQRLHRRLDNLSRNRKAHS